jgi:hypothetical protein
MYRCKCCSGSNLQDGMRVEPTDFCVAKPQRALPFGIQGNRRGMRRAEKRQNRQIQQLYLCLRLMAGLVRMVVMAVLMGR